MTFKATLLALLMLPQFHEDRASQADKAAQRNGIADAIAAEKLTPDQAAFLVAWGDAETHYSLRIHAGRCAKWECDRGRARGPWQLHRSADMTADTWARMHGIENVRVQAREAARRVRWALRECRGDARGAFALLGGRGCAGSIPGVDARVATFERLRRRM